jgi:hypothetical protein
LQQESGVTSPTAPPTYNVPQPYFNANYTVVTPPGFQEAGSSGAIVPIPSNVNQPQDYRLNNGVGIPTVALPHAGEAVGPGQVDPTASMTPSFLSSSPLFGARFLSPTLAASDTYEDNVNASLQSSVITNSLSAGLSPSEIARLRGELSQSSAGSLAAGTPTPGGPGTPLNSAVPSSAVPLTGAAQIPGAAPVAGTTGATSFSSAPLNTALPSGLISSAPGDVSTGQSSRQNLSTLVNVSDQSPQYAKLRAQLEQYEAAHPKTDEEANRLFQAALRARREYQQSQTQKRGGSTTQPVRSGNASNSTGPGPGPIQGTTPIAGLPTAPAPVEIGSIGASIQSQGLSQLVQDGEKLAREQKFKDAIAKFLDARQVAPNNMLIAIDLANAELGAGFYEQASQYLHDAFTIDPALLRGKYDLTTILGPDRLQILIADLKRVASTNDSPTPVFLLGYLSYNSGEPEKAIQYLRLAETRSGGSDAVIDSLRQHWGLVSPSPAPTTLPTP